MEEYAQLQGGYGHQPRPPYTYDGQAGYMYPTAWQYAYAAQQQHHLPATQPAYAPQQTHPYHVHGQWQAQQHLWGQQHSGHALAATGAHMDDPMATQQQQYSHPQHIHAMYHAATDQQTPSAPSAAVGAPSSAPPWLPHPPLPPHLHAQPALHTTPNAVSSYPSASSTCAAPTMYAPYHHGAPQGSMGPVSAHHMHQAGYPPTPEAPHPFATDPSSAHQSPAIIAQPVHAQHPYSATPMAATLPTSQSTSGQQEPVNYYSMYLRYARPQTEAVAPAAEAQPPLPTASNPPLPDDSDTSSMKAADMSQPSTPTDSLMPSTGNSCSSLGPPPDTPAEPPLPPTPAPILVAPCTDAETIFMAPGRRHRPTQLVVIIRGVPGSGKSWLAQQLRRLEVDTFHARAPRILSIDSYFVTEDDDSGREEYRYDPHMEAKYEETLNTRLAQTLMDAQHSLVIVDAPLLQAARLQTFWATAKAAQYEVYVTQLPSQDAATCHARNVHDRSLADIEAAVASMEQPPPAVMRLDCSTLVRSEPLGVTGAVPLPPETPWTPSGGAQQQRSASQVVQGRISRGHRAASADSEGDDEHDGFKDSDVLASITAAFPTQTVGEEGRSRWEDMGMEEGDGGRRSRWDDDDEDAAEFRLHGPKTITNKGSSTVRKSDGRKNGSALVDFLMRSRGKRVRKKNVRWPDQVPEDEEDVVLLGRPRQLEVVHVLEGLGPGVAEKPTHKRNFSDAVAAEHSAERLMQRNSWQMF